MKRNLLSILFICITAMLGQSIAVPVHAQEQEEISIGTPDKLAEFRNNINTGKDDYTNKTVKLSANIALSGDWTPIGTADNKFKGTFDGNGYCISGLNVNINSDFPLGGGLFFFIDKDAIVKNLGVEGTVRVTFNEYNVNAGGITGYNNGEIQNCYTDVTVTATTTGISAAGGIAGTNNGTISDCYTVGSNTAGSNAGGIAGLNDGTIKQCYATGAVSANNVGGIAGANGNGSSISNCIALNASITGSKKNRIVSTNSGTLAGNYASNVISGAQWNLTELNDRDGQSMSKDEFTNTNTATGPFTNWSSETWVLTTDKLPTFNNFYATQPVADITRRIAMLLTSIATADDLETFCYVVNDGETYEEVTVKLTAPITVTDWTESIGTSQNIFNGTFDGQGYVINLTGSTSLFGQIGEYGSSEGTVQNLGVNATINNETGSFGGIAMTNKGTIQQCYTVGSITGTYGGGIVGQNEGAIRDCYSTVSITAIQGAAGGIAQINKGTIERCYATGAISGGSESGGIAGNNYSGNNYSGSITNCIALNTSIKGNIDLGRITGTNKGTLTTNYASPAIPGTWNYKGAALQDGADLDDNNFIGKGAGVGAFTNWSGDNWEFGDKTKLPTLTGFQAAQPVASITRKSVMPAIITSAADLAEFRDAVNSGTTYTDKTVTLTADITLSGNWTPIGNATNKFNGTFEGGGHCISGLSVTINNKGNQYGGLFGYIDSKGTVQNLGVKGTVSVISTDAVAYAGGITGYNLGTIQHCYTDVAVTTSAKNSGTTNIGGIAGQNNNKISNCYTRGNSTAVTSAGGIAGKSDKGTIEQCYATGAVEATHTGVGSAGGIVGNSLTGSSYTNCIALNSSIITEEYSGRIASNPNGTFTGNYASPAIPGTWSNTGATTINGADLTEGNFIDKGSGASAFTYWQTAIWDFTNADEMPKLKTTGLTSNIVIAGQDPMPTRADLLEKIIKIETAVTYNATTHKDQSIRVLDKGIFTVNADGASLKKLTINEGGQVVATKAFTCGKLLAPRTLGNRWTAYSSPVEMKAVAKEGTKFYTKTGYKTPSEEDQKWSSTGDEDLISTPCSLTSPTLVSVNGNSDVKIDVTFTATPAEGSTSLTIPVEGTATTGSALSTGIFLLSQNPTLKNLTIPVAYILNADGERFERKAPATVKPFEAYMVANAATTKAVMSLRAGDSATANESIAPDSHFRLWGSDGQLHLSADRASRVSIYTASGKLLRAFTLTSEQTLALGSGIYFVHSNNITYKVSL